MLKFRFEEIVYIKQLIAFEIHKYLLTHPEKKGKVDIQNYEIKSLIYNRVINRIQDMISLDDSTEILFTLD